jgi:hypothetical protein
MLLDGSEGAAAPFAGWREPQKAVASSPCAEALPRMDLNNSAMCTVGTLISRHNQLSGNGAIVVQPRVGDPKRKKAQSARLGLPRCNSEDSTREIRTSSRIRPKARHDV